MPRAGWLVTAVPVAVAGIVFGLLGRIVSRSLQTRDAILGAAHRSALKVLLLPPRSDADDLGLRLLVLMSLESDIPDELELSVGDRKAMLDLRHRTRNVKALSKSVTLLYALNTSSLIVGVLLVCWGAVDCFFRG